MTTLQPPTWLQGLSTHTAQGERLRLQGIMGPKGGCGGLSSPLVTQNTTPDLSILCARERFFIPGSSDANQGMYHVYNDATLRVTNGVTAGHATLTRIDLVIAEIRDAAYSGANNDWQYRVVAGAPGSGTKPALPANSIEIGTLTVPAAASTILSSYFTQTVLPATTRGGVAVVADSTARLALPLPYTGMHAFETSTLREYVYTGSAWASVSSGDGKVVQSGSAVVTTNAGGGLSFPFPVAFSSTPYCICNSGDFNVFEGSLAGNGTNASGYNGVAMKADNTRVISSTIRIDFIAHGPM